MTFDKLIAATSLILLASCGSSSSSDSSASTATVAANPSDRTNLPAVELAAGDPSTAVGEPGGANFVVRAADGSDAARLYTTFASRTDEGAYIWSNAYSNSSAYYIKNPGDGQDGVVVGGYYSGNTVATSDDLVLSGFAGETYGAPTSGIVQYDGVYTIGSVSGNQTIRTDITVDANAGTLASAADNLNVVGNVTGNDIGGTVTYNNSAAPLEGGFFGTQILGAFEGSDFGGTMYGSQKVTPAQ